MHRPSRPVTPRETAVRALLRIEEDGAYVGLIGSDGAADARAAAQATDLVAGVTRQRRWLDFLLTQFYRGDYFGLEPAMRQILRLGAYDLLFADTPGYAAVNESVDLAKRMLRRGAGGLANGVLRSITRRLDNLPQPNTGDRARDIAIRHSYPNWIVKRWIARFGEAEAVELLDYHNRRPTYGVRPNRLKWGGDGFADALRETGAEFEASPWVAQMVRMERLRVLREKRWLAEGRCAVQDEAAALVVSVLAPKPGETIWDLCAAPGGKALLAAETMALAEREAPAEVPGHVAAADIHSGRVRLIERSADAHGLSDRITTHVADALDPDAFDDLPMPDAILIDAPCSGLGVLAKRADLRWQRTPEDLADLARLQADLLDAAAQHVPPGARLVYATCSTEREENEAQIEAFLARTPGFELEPVGERVPEAMRTPGGFYAALPHRHATDGAFAAILRRAQNGTPPVAP